VGEISSKYVSESSERLTTKNAWAMYARRRWPNNGVKGSMAEWSLTEGEAKGLIYAQISQPTIDKILDHPNGGFGLGLLILTIKTKTRLENYIEQQAREANCEKRTFEAEEHRLDDMQARLAGRNRLDRDTAE